MDKRFTPDILAAARASMRDSSPHIPASITAAQWALESEYGLHQSGKNNCFGIKAVGGQACTTRLTKECVAGGKWVTIPQHFADYPSLAAGFTAHAALLAHGSPYADARKLLPDADRFGEEMAKHYATDPRYWQKLKQIIDANGLRSLDEPVTLQPNPAPAAPPAAVVASAPPVEPAPEPAPKIGPALAPSSANRSTGLFAHLVAWLRGRPA